MATTLNTMNVSPLAFVSASKWFAHNRAYSYGQVLPLVAPLNKLPPFVIARDETDTGAHNWTLINYNTGTETSIAAEVLSTGLTGYTVDGKTMTTYPGSVNLPGIDMIEGLYYIRFEDDMANLIYSEVFAWQDNLDNNDKYVKVEWWHGEDFTYPGGTIRYDWPFKMWAYLYTDLGKPERMKKEEIEERDGRKLYLKQISWKVFKFEFRCPEYLVDAIDLVWQHDVCQVTHMGRVYEVEEFVMNTEWLDVGDFARVTIEFRTDTVVVVNGRSYGEFEYEEEECGCLEANYPATAWMTYDSVEYLGHYWTDELGANHSLAVGEYVVIDGPLFNTLKQWNGSSYATISINAGETVCLAHDSRNPYARGSNYFFRTTSLGGSLSQVPLVNSESNVGDMYTISGETFDNTIIEVWLRTDAGDILEGTYTENEFTSGITFDATGSNAYFVRARTYICENIGESDVTVLEGIGFDEIGVDEIN